MARPNLILAPQPRPNHLANLVLAPQPRPKHLANKNLGSSDGDGSQGPSQELQTSYLLLGEPLLVMSNRISGSLSQVLPPSITLKGFYVSFYRL